MRIVTFFLWELKVTAQNTMCLGLAETFLKSVIFAGVCMLDISFLLYLAIAEVPVNL